MVLVQQQIGATAGQYPCPNDRLLTTAPLVQLMVLAPTGLPTALRLYFKHKTQQKTRYFSLKLKTLVFEELRVSFSKELVFAQLYTNFHLSCSCSYIYSKLISICTSRLSMPPPLSPIHYVHHLKLNDYSLELWLHLIVLQAAWEANKSFDNNVSDIWHFSVVTC